MEVRITKQRVAMAALFVLAGVGLASLLSPLIGTALANVGQVVNISDHSSAANFAKVDAGGKLAVGDGGGSLTVDGKVADANLATAYRATGFVTDGGGCTSVAIAPAGKAIVLTGIDIDAYSVGTSGTSFLISTIGASDCSGILTYHDFTARGERQLAFNPGVIIHPGQSLAMFTGAMNAVVLATGYTVPASAAPPSAEETRATNVPTRHP